MKKFLLIAVTGLVLLTYCSPALAMGPVSLDAKLGLYSQYVWRGVVVNPEAVAQPQLKASILGMGADLWGNVDLTDIHDNKMELNEVNYKAAYGVGFPMMSVEFGLIHYVYPNTDNNATTEIFAAGSLGVLFSPSLAIHYDFDEIKGTYISLGASHTVPASGAVNLEIGANLGFGSKGWVTGLFGAGPQAADKTGMTDFLLTVGAPFGNLIPLVTITPSVAYSTLLGEAKDAYDAVDTDTDAFYYGISAAFSF